jgi:hypothetical protein
MPVDWAQYGQFDRVPGKGGLQTSETSSNLVDVGEKRH